MKPTRLELRQSPTLRVDASKLLPERLDECAPQDLAHRTILCGAQQIAAGDLFQVHAGAPGMVHLVGDLSRFDALASRLCAGTVHIDGDVGHRLAAEMRGGHVLVNGSAGDLTAASLRGGRVAVTASIGDDGVGPLRGHVVGMRGGELIVGGSAGARLGARMRRGTVVVQGSVAEGCASAMVAGTIVVLGSIGPFVGFGMRRGTIITHRDPLPLEEDLRFTAPEQVELGFLQLLWRAIPTLQAVIAREGVGPTTVQRRIGDRTCGGQGEWIFLRF